MRVLSLSYFQCWWNQEILLFGIFSRMEESLEHGHGGMVMGGSGAKYRVGRKLCQ